MLADVYHTATFAHVAYTQRAAPHTLQESAHGSPEPTPAALGVGLHFVLKRGRFLSFISLIFLLK